MHFQPPCKAISLHCVILSEFCFIRADAKEERNFTNALYGMNDMKKPLSDDSTSNDMEYNEVYNGGNKLENEYSSVGEPQYHYVRY